MRRAGIRISPHYPRDAGTARSVVAGLSTAHRLRGFTLVEMLIVILTAGVLMSLATASLVMLVRLDGAARQRGQATDTLANLARQFRADVHEARAASAAGPADPGGRQTLGLTLPDGRKITYVAADERVIRAQEGGPAGKREDRFPLPAGCRATVSLARRDAAEVAALTVASSAPAGLSLRIAAAVGRDHRPAGPQEKPKE
jgi:prepilin-type N-terminal cleavage/methylation domain-containing protein